MNRRSGKQIGSLLLTAFILLLLFSSTAQHALGYLIDAGLSGVSLAAHGLRAMGGDAAVAMAGAAAVSAPIAVAALVSAKRRHRADHRAGRRDRGLCAGCGYSLDGLMSDRCPECGERLEEVRRVRRGEV